MRWDLVCMWLRGCLTLGSRPNDAGVPLLFVPCARRDGWFSCSPATQHNTTGGVAGHGIVKAVLGCVVRAALRKTQREEADCLRGGNVVPVKAGGEP